MHVKVLEERKYKDSTEYGVDAAVRLVKRSTRAKKSQPSPLASLSQVPTRLPLSR